MSDEFKDAIKAGGGGDTKTWDKEGVLIGTYKTMKSNVGPNSSNLYIINADDEEQDVGVWGSTVLDDRFEEVPEGSRVRIECLGKKTSKRGNEFTDYDLQYIKPKTDWADEAKETVDNATTEK